MKPQQVILRLTDKQDGTINVRLEFKPSIAASATATPAVLLALQLIEHANKLARWAATPQEAAQ